MFAITRIVLFTAAIYMGLALGGIQTNATTPPNYMALIEEKNEKMSALLENRAQINDTVTFLHEHISEQAVFDMSMSNATMPKDAPQANIQMSKADYINSFIQGTHYVEDYHIDIKTVEVQPTNGGNSVMSKEIMTEQGVAMNPNDIKDPGKAFISTTKCVTIHEIKDEKAVSVRAKCHTDTSFLNAV